MEQLMATLQNVLEFMGMRINLPGLGSFTLLELLTSLTIFLILIWFTRKFFASAKKEFTRFEHTKHPTATHAAHSYIAPIYSFIFNYPYMAIMAGIVALLLLKMFSPILLLIVFVSPFVAWREINNWIAGVMMKRNPVYTPGMVMIIEEQALILNTIGRQDTQLLDATGNVQAISNRTVLQKAKRCIHPGDHPIVLGFNFSITTDQPKESIHATVIQTAQQIPGVVSVDRLRIEKVDSFDGATYNVFVYCKIQPMEAFELIRTIQTIQEDSIADFAKGSFLQFWPPALKNKPIIDLPQIISETFQNTRKNDGDDDEPFDLS